MTDLTLAFTEPVGTGDLVVLGPSLGTSTILWENVIPLLAERYRVVAWDLPGHGSSPPASGPFDVADIAAAVSAATAEYAVADFFYAGVSLGGAVGLELCLLAPAVVRAAAILASGAQLGDAAAWHDRAAQVRSLSTSSVIIQSAERWFAPESMAREPDLSGRLLHALQDADDESYALCCEALADYDVRDQLNEIDVPILALWGEHDAVAPEAKSRQIADDVGHGIIGRVADAAHLPPAEQPAAVADALLTFFDAIEQRSRS